MAAKDKLAALLRAADIEIDGGDPWDLRVHDERFYARVLADGTLGAGESYMDGWWDVPRLDEFFARVHRARLERELRTAGVLAQVTLSKIRNLQGRSLSTRVARRHYDLSNDLYVAMLGPTMQYTCAYYGTDGVDRTLDEAQRLKLDLIARKLHLQPGMTVLELGGGFGELAYHLARHHDCRVVSYNISREQVEFARTRCDGLPVEFRLQDYREAAADAATYDRVVSIGLMEHVGPKNYRHFFEIANARLAPGGLALVHTIGGNVSKSTTDRWIDKYIFPGGVIPSERQIAAAKEGLLVLEDWHNFGPDYDRTLLAWDANFRAAWQALRSDPQLDERFYRMWRYYLNSTAGGFRARALHLWQLVLSRGDVPRYVPVR
ncbi:MAG: cyclopropane fatty acyl phospholipid synthase [Steroidobacteraceae bacterium]